MRKHMMKKRRTTLKESKESVKQNLIKILISDDPKSEYGIGGSYPIAQSVVESDEFESILTTALLEAADIEEDLELLESVGILFDKEEIENLIYEKHINEEPGFDTETFAEHLAEVIVYNNDDTAGKKEDLMKLASDDFDSTEDYLKSLFLVDEFISDYLGNI